MNPNESSENPASSKTESATSKQSGKEEDIQPVDEPLFVTRTAFLVQSDIVLNSEPLNEKEPFTVSSHHEKPCTCKLCKCQPCKDPKVPKYERPNFEALPTKIPESKQKACIKCLCEKCRCKNCIETGKKRSTSYDDSDLSISEILKLLNIKEDPIKVAPQKKHKKEKDIASTTKSSKAEDDSISESKAVDSKPGKTEIPDSEPEKVGNQDDELSEISSSFNEGTLGAIDDDLYGTRKTPKGKRSAVKFMQAETPEPDQTLALSEFSSYVDEIQSPIFSEEISPQTSSSDVSGITTEDTNITTEEKSIESLQTDSIEGETRKITQTMIQTEERATDFHPHDVGLPCDCEVCQECYLPPCVDSDKKEETQKGDLIRSEADDLSNGTQNDILEEHELEGGDTEYVDKFEQEVPASRDTNKHTENENYKRTEAPEKDDRNEETTSSPGKMTNEEDKTIGIEENEAEGTTKEKMNVEGIEECAAGGTPKMVEKESSSDTQGGVDKLASRHAGEAIMEKDKISEKRIPGEEENMNDEFKCAAGGTPKKKGVERSPKDSGVHSLSNFTEVKSGPLANVKNSPSPVAITDKYDTTSEQISRQEASDIPPEKVILPKIEETSNISIPEDKEPESIEIPIVEATSDEKKTEEMPDNEIIPETGETSDIPVPGKDSKKIYPHDFGLPCDCEACACFKAPCINSKNPNEGPMSVEEVPKMAEPTNFDNVNQPDKINSQPVAEATGLSPNLATETSVALKEILIEQMEEKKDINESDSYLKSLSDHAVQLVRSISASAEELVSEAIHNNIDKQESSDTQGGIDKLASHYEEMLAQELNNMKIGNEQVSQNLTVDQHLVDQVISHEEKLPGSTLMRTSNLGTGAGKENLVDMDKTELKSAPLTKSTSVRTNNSETDAKGTENPVDLDKREPEFATLPGSTSVRTNNSDTDASGTKNPVDMDKTDLEFAPEKSVLADDTVITEKPDSITEESNLHKKELLLSKGYCEICHCMNCHHIKIKDNGNNSDDRENTAAKANLNDFTSNKDELFEPTESKQTSNGQILEASDSNVGKSTFNKKNGDMKIEDNGSNLGEANNTSRKVNLNGTTSNRDRLFERTESELASNGKILEASDTNVGKSSLNKKNDDIKIEDNGSKSKETKNTSGKVNLNDSTSDRDELSGLQSELASNGEILEVNNSDVGKSTYNKENEDIIEFPVSIEVRNISAEDSQEESDLHKKELLLLKGFCEICQCIDCHHMKREYNGNKSEETKNTSTEVSLNESTSNRDRLLSDFTESELEWDGKILEATDSNVGKSTSNKEKDDIVEVSIISTEGPKVTSNETIDKSKDVISPNEETPQGSEHIMNTPTEFSERAVENNDDIKLSPKEPYSNIDPSSQGESPGTSVIPTVKNQSPVETKYLHDFGLPCNCDSCRSAKSPCVNQKPQLENSTNPPETSEKPLETTENEAEKMSKKSIGVSEEGSASEI